MIYIDKSGHLISDESEKELHLFALRIGLDREKQFKRERLSRYNCTKKQAGDAIIMGARLVSSRDIVRKLNALNKKDLDLDKNGIRIYTTKGESK